MPFEIRPANEQLPDPEAEPIRPRVAHAQRHADPYGDVLPPPPPATGRPLAQRMQQAQIDDERAIYGTDEARRSRRNSGLYADDDYYGMYSNNIWSSLLFGNDRCYGWHGEYRMMRFAAGVVFSVLYLMIRGCS